MKMRPNGLSDLLQVVSVLSIQETGLVYNVAKMLGITKTTYSESNTEQPLTSTENVSSTSSIIADSSKVEGSQGETYIDKESETQINIERLEKHQQSKKQPNWYAKAIPWENRIGEQKSLHTSLLNPKWTRNILADSLSSLTADGDLDIASIMDLLTNGKPIDRLPHETIPTLRFGINVLIDTNSAMALFTRDQKDVLDSISLLFPKNNYQIKFFQESPLRGVYSSGEKKAFRFPPPGTMILIMSDIGASGSRFLSHHILLEEWENFALGAKSAGCTVVALSPYNPNKYPHSIHRLIRFIHWDRPRVSIAYSKKFVSPYQGADFRLNTFQEQYPDVYQLAKYASLAIRIEPDLLRLLRLELLPHIDAGVEIDLWYSSLVATQSLTALILLPELQASLRQELAQSGLEDAWRVLKRYRDTTNPPLSIRVEEEVIYHALRGKEHNEEAIRDLLQATLKTVLEQGQQERGLLRWALRAMPAIEQIVPSLDVKRLTVQIQNAAGTRTSSKAVRFDSYVSVDDVSWLLPEDIETFTVQVGVRLIGGQVEFSDPPTNGALTIDLPKTSPRIIELIHPSSEETELIELERNTKAYSSYSEGTLIRTITLEQFRITTVNQAGITSTRFPIGELHALIIGVSSKVLSPLPGVEVDVRRLLVALDGFENSHVEMLRDPSAIEIYERVERFTRGLSSNDIGFLYFAGHGYKPADGNIMLVAADPVIDKNENSNLINVSYILEKLASSRSNQIILILDTSQSGAVNPIPNGIVITSSSSHQSAVDSVEQFNNQSPFGYFLVKGLQGEADINHDGIISARELFKFIEANMKQHQVEQEPQLITLHTSDIIIGRVKSSGDEAQYKNLSSAIVRVYDGELVRATGFLLSNRLIITTAHALGSDLGKLNKPVYVDFPFLNPTTKYSTRIVFYRPRSESEQYANLDDIAIIELSSPAPPEARPLKLANHIPDNVEGNLFYTLSGSLLGESPQSFNGRIQRYLPDGNLQVSIDNLSRFEGLSGAPIFLPSINGVIGIFAQIYVGEKSNVEYSIAYPIDQSVLSTWLPLTTAQSELSETDTKRVFIEPQLIDAGWNTEPYILRTEWQPQREQNQSLFFIDYALFKQGDSSPIALVETKTLGDETFGAEEQARHYARNLGIRFVFAANGRSIIQIDTLKNDRRVFDTFPSPDSLVAQLEIENSSSSKIKNLFISHSRDDSAWVLELWQQMRDRLPYDTWLDRRLLAGSARWDAILDNIEASDCFIFVITPKSVGSVYCRAELEYAVALNKPIVPLMLKSAPLPENLQDIQYLLVDESMSIDVLLTRLDLALSQIKLSYAQGRYKSISAPRPPLPTVPQTSEGLSQFYLEPKTYYTVQTHLSLELAQNYTGGMLLVYATEEYNMPNNSPTSNPASVHQRWCEVASLTDDRDSEIWDHHKSALRAMLLNKYQSQAVTVENYEKALNRIARSIRQYDARPVVLHISLPPSRLQIGDSYSEFPNHREYIVKDLDISEYEIVDIPCSSEAKEIKLVRVLETSQQLEVLVTQILKAEGKLSDDKQLPLRELWRQLLITNIKIPAEHSRIMDDFWKLRNRVAHQTSESIDEGEIDQLLKDIQRVIRWLESLDSHDKTSEEINKLHEQALSYFRAGQYQNALDSYQHILVQVRQNGSTQHEANTLQALGDAYGRVARFEQSLAAYEQALSLYQKLGDRQGEANTLQALGDAYGRVARFEQSLAVYEQALSLYQKLGDRQGEANTLQALGDAYGRVARFEQSLAVYEQALLIYRRIGNLGNEAEILTQLGVILYDQQDFDKARSYFEQGLEISRKIGNRTEEAKLLNNIGLALGNQNEPQRAIDYLQNALVIYREIEDKRGEGNVLRGLGITSRMLNDRDRAQRYLNEAIEILESADEFDVASDTRRILAELTSNSKISIELLLPAPFVWIQIPSGKAFLRQGGDIPSEGTMFDVSEFYISKYPITNSQFAVFIEANGYKTRKFWTIGGWEFIQKNSLTSPLYSNDKKWNGPNQPVVGVSFYEALAFTSWLSEKLELTITLPTEQHWHRAASGANGYLYPWGNTWNQTNANLGRISRTTNVEQFPQGSSPFGVHDMLGNVWEWTLTNSTSEAQSIETTVPRVVKGGSWKSEGQNVETRRSYAPDYRANDIGFRVVY